MKVADCLREGLLKKSAPFLEAVQKSLDAAEKYLKKAEADLGIKNYEMVIVQAYTAMFHAGRALLFKDGFKERSHLCIIAYLKEQYADKALLDPKYVHILDAYRELRHTAIYALEYSAKEDDAKTALASAKEFVTQIKKLI